MFTVVEDRANGELPWRVVNGWETTEPWHWGPCFRVRERALRYAAFMEWWRAQTEVLGVLVTANGGAW